MDRPTKGSLDPTDREPAPDTRGSPERDDVWAAALRALQDVAHQREQDGMAPPQTMPDRAVGDLPTRPDGGPPPGLIHPPRRPERAAPSGPAPAVDETLEALQVLAHRYSPYGTQPPASSSPVSERPHVPPGEPSFAPDEINYQPPPPDIYQPPPPDDYQLPPPPDVFEEPAPGARLLTRRRRWTSIVLVLASAAVLAVVLVGALSLSRQFFQSRAIRAERPAPTAQEHLPERPATSPASGAAAGSLSAVAIAAHSADGIPDLRAIEKAMADCDEEAANNRDALYFLIVPSVSPIKDYSHWAPVSVGDIGTSVILLRSKDALDGLKTGALAVYTGAYKFSIVDSSTDVASDWGPVTGVAKFVKLDAAPIAGFRVRFSFADFVGDTPSNFRFPRDKGVCYWVSALLRT